METTNILLVDDHRGGREWLRRTLELETDHKVMGATAETCETTDRVKAFSLDTLLKDVKMPEEDGISLTRQFTKEPPSCDVIMLTCYHEYLNQTIKDGAVGYVLNDVEPEELVRALQIIRKGHSTFNLPSSKSNLLNLIVKVEGKQQTCLKERESNVLRLIADGLTTREIGKQLFLSDASIKRSVCIIKEKLDAQTRPGLVSEACKRGLI